MAVLQTDVGRDRVAVDIRLDKVVLTVEQGRSSSAHTALTPADARQIAAMLQQAASDTERTPAS